MCVCACVCVCVCLMPCGTTSGHTSHTTFRDTKAPSSHYSASSQSAAKRAKAALLPCVSALPLPPPPPRERGWRLSAESEAEVYRADPGADPADELVVNVLYRNTGPGVRSTSAHFATPVLEYPSKKKAPKPKSRKRGRPGAAGREHDAADRGAAKRSRAHRGVEELPWRRRDSGAPLPTEERFAAAQPKRRIERLRALMRLAGEQNKKTVFLFSDTQINHEFFVEDISNVLNTGEVPNLMEAGDLGTIFEAIRGRAKAAFDF